MRDDHILPHFHCCELFHGRNFSLKFLPKVSLSQVFYLEQQFPVKGHVGTLIMKIRSFVSLRFFTKSQNIGYMDS